MGFCRRKNKANFVLLLFSPQALGLSVVEWLPGGKTNFNGWALNLLGNIFIYRKEFFLETFVYYVTA
jgi:hypothetical protein